MIVNLYDQHSFDQIPWSEIDNGAYIQAYFEHLVRDGVQQYIENVKTDLYFIRIDHLLLPITKNDSQYENSYVCSPYTHYISYAKEELWELGNKPLEYIFEKIISLLGFCLRKSSFNKVVIVNNWLLSTNLYSAQLTSQQMKDLTACLTEAFPEHTIMFRSLNNKLHLSMMRDFREAGYRKIMSRSIYLLNEDAGSNLTGKEKKLLRQDASLFAKHMLLVEETPRNIERYASCAYELYRQLYIQKYSQHNPQFNMRYFNEIMKKNLMHFKWIKNEDVVGVIGYFTVHSVLTTPILGYNTKIGKQLGLYRILSYLITKEILDHGYIGHRSAGASEFKRKRGAKQYIEYNVIYQKHLSFSRKWSWMLVKWVMDRFVEPLAKKRKF
ncbi:hypothetical protein [Cytobacillus gottheilii]|uniref:GNAT family N-acetyltransferase n=1 Tax=Cytobacillus gottheilii TaxID=859144 RepID=A0ABX8F8C0_9BACI|nr:hypothetical protein [Cytobacillus gottheilii]QVY59767.1 hypothetical protein J1899_11895 [Cytobacillus gottheilii]